MRLDTLDVCEKTWYNYHDIKRITFYNYKNHLLSGHVRVVYRNGGLKKPRPNTVVIVNNINKIVEKKFR